MPKEKKSKAPKIAPQEDAPQATPTAEPTKEESPAPSQSTEEKPKRKKTPKADASPESPAPQESPAPPAPTESKAAPGETPNAPAPEPTEKPKKRRAPKAEAKAEPAPEASPAPPSEAEAKEPAPEEHAPTPDAAPTEKPKKKRAKKEASPTAETSPEAQPSDEAPLEVKPKSPRTAKNKGPKTIAEEIEEIFIDERVIYFPVKHFSPVCSYHVVKLIREIRPVGVLVEGPQDANDLIPYMVHKDTKTPFTIFSSYADRDNQFGLNGVLSPSESIPARFRGWWPMTEYAPEYAALKAGHEVGAKLEFCDAPLTATIPYHHVPQKQEVQVVNDRHLAESAYFDALRRAQRRRSFDEFWNANFEVGGLGLSARDFMRRVLTFAYCARNLSPNPLALEADGTILREAHMRFVLDNFLKANPEGKVVVVTGAFHSVALPSTKKQKAKVRADKNLETMLTGHSFRALSTLYHLNQMPNYGQMVWDSMTTGSEEPFNTAALTLLLEAMRKAREAKEGLSTADGVEAYRLARNLATLRQNHSVTLEDLTDAAQLAYIKGDKRIRGIEVERALRDVLTGNRVGRVTSSAGQAPLMRDYYEQCRAYKLDTTGEAKAVRCDLGKQEGHRNKSAFLHQCTFLQVPMFYDLETSRAYSFSGATGPSHYKGPDIVSGENMHLIGETWGVKWSETVDDRLIELSDRGASMTQAAASVLREELAKSVGNAAQTTSLLLKSAQMMLVDLFDDLLTAVEDAISVDTAFESLVKALHDFVVLYSYRDTVATQGHKRLLAAVSTVFNKSCIVMPMISNEEGQGIKTSLEALQTLVRVALTFEGVELDRQLLVERLQETVADPEGASVIRGAGFGILYSFGATREKIVATELENYLRSSQDRLLEAGSFLDGLFMSAKNIFMSSPRLLRAINRVLGEIDWETFKSLLPHLRRAFTQFIPTEIDQISTKVSEEIGLLTQESADVPISAALGVVGATADARVSALLEGWL